MMKSILTPAGTKKLRTYAHSKTAVVLDFDGTIAPIIQHRQKSKIPSKTERLLRELVELYPTAILSGRGLRNVRGHLSGISFGEVVGNHGLEWSGSRASRRMRKEVTSWKRRILRAMREGEIPSEGIDIEDKSLSLSMHYRDAPNRERARKKIEAFLTGIPGLRAIPGKSVFNIVPDVDVNKGSALLKLRRRLRCERVIYVGDDWTDEDVFALRPKTFLLDVRVGHSRRSKARYFIPEQPEIDRFLEVLIEERKRLNEPKMASSNR
jgi:trehalose 6-phosphate phosphatase